MDTIRSAAGLAVMAAVMISIVGTTPAEGAPHDKKALLFEAAGVPVPTFECSTATVDPTPSALEGPAQLAKAGKYQAAYDAYLALVEIHPYSGVLQTRLGGLALHHLSGKLADAVGHYSKAVNLFDAGCPGSDKDQWTAVEGLGLAYILQGKYDDSLPWFARAAKTWPTIGETQYNLACARCKTGDVEGCYQALEACFEASSKGAAPAFMKGKDKSVAQWIASSKTDTDLAPLRSHPIHGKSYESLVQRY